MAPKLFLGVRCQVSGLRGNEVTNSNYMDVEDLLEKTLERKVPERERRWQLAEKTVVYGVKNESFLQGWPRYHFPKLRGRPITTEHVS